MSDNILNYYRDYHKNGGIYKLSDYNGSSRVLMFTNWLRANLKPGDKVLDIGCGDGTYSEIMPEFSWTGIDINEEKKEYLGTRLVSNIENTPYELEEGSFSAVICSEVLEHLFDPEKVHQEAHRLLKPRGIYAISTPNFDWVEHHYGAFRQVLFDPAESHTKEHIRFYTLDSHKTMLDKAGFRIVDFMGADTQFGTFFGAARAFLGKEVFKEKTVGEIDYMIGRMFPTISHTIGVLGVKV